MKDRKRLVLWIVSLAMLCAGFVIIRYAMFDLHGMKEWPFVLFLSSLIVMSVSAFAGARLIPACTVVAYILGFIAGKLFQQDGVDPGGGATNNLWIIWTAVYLALVLFAVIGEVIAVRKGKREATT